MNYIAMNLVTMLSDLTDVSNVGMRILLNTRKFARWEGGKAQLRPRSRFG